MSRRLLPLLPLLAAVSWALSTSASPTNAGAGTPEDVTSEQVLALIQQYGLPETQAREAVTQSDVVYDFMMKHFDDNRFGSIWVEYEPTYSVHVRYLDKSFESEVETLATSLGGEVVRHTGGAPLHELRGAARQLTTESAIAFWLDEKAGFLEVSADDLVKTDDLKTIETRYLQGSPDFRVTTVPALAAAAGDDVYYRQGGYYFAQCTAGFMFESATLSGFGTAGHCTDFDSYVGGFYSAAPTLLFESCSGYDVQTQAFQYSPSPSSGFRNKPGSGILQIENLAGGYYIGQQTKKVGLQANGAAGTNFGTVQGFGTLGLGAGGDCPAHNITGLSTTNSAAAGDSGGPIFLIYNGRYYLGGQTAGGGSNVSSANWVPWIPLPSGAHICTKANPC